MAKKTIFITGASSGIGRSTAIAFAKLYSSKGGELTLILTGRRTSALEEVKSEIEARFPGVKVHVGALDVTDPKMVFSVFADFAAKVTAPYSSSSPTQGLRKIGKIDVVLVNSGIGDGNVNVGSWEAFEQQNLCMQTNLIGAMATVHAAVAHFRKVGGGQVVAIGSVAAFKGVAKNAAYCTSKAALQTFMEAVASEGVSQNIKVTVIHPGFIDTPMNQ
ncbi:hypothetical protein HK101_007662 [Irineochytrium annulatum]|nr:hypothetical protein HK101_007662 [Irineochytrium annulatum]